MLYNFGREEKVDREALKRLVASINRFLGPEEVLKGQAQETQGALRFVGSRSLGGVWVLDQLWRERGGDPGARGSGGAPALPGHGFPP